MVEQNVDKAIVEIAGLPGYRSHYDGNFVWEIGVPVNEPVYRTENGRYISGLYFVGQFKEVLRFVKKHGYLTTWVNDKTVCSINRYIICKVEARNYKKLWRHNPYVNVIQKYICSDLKITEIIGEMFLLDGRHNWIYIPSKEEQK